MTATNEELAKRVDALEKRFNGLENECIPWILNRIDELERLAEDSARAYNAHIGRYHQDKPTDPQPAQSPVCHHTVMLMSNPPKCQLCGWVQEERPSPPDPYKEFKDCLAGGGEIEAKDENGMWYTAQRRTDGTVTPWGFTSPPDHYRIARPAHKAATWHCSVCGESGDGSGAEHVCVEDDKLAQNAEEVDGPADMRRVSSCLTYNGPKAEGLAKHLLLCAAMKIETLRAKLAEAEKSREYWMHECLGRETEGDDRDAELRRLNSKLAEAEEQVKRARSGQIAWMRDSLRNWLLLADSEKSNAELVLKLRDEIERLRRFHACFKPLEQSAGVVLKETHEDAHAAWVAAKGTA